MPFFDAENDTLTAENAQQVLEIACTSPVTLSTFFIVDNWNKQFKLIRSAIEHGGDINKVNLDNVGFFSFGNDSPGFVIARACSFGLHAIAQRIGDMYISQYQKGYYDYEKLQESFCEAVSYIFNKEADKSLALIDGLISKLNDAFEQSNGFDNPYSPCHEYVSQFICNLLKDDIQTLIALIKEAPERFAFPLKLIFNNKLNTINPIEKLGIAGANKPYALAVAALASVSPELASRVHREYRAIHIASLSNNTHERHEHIVLQLKYATDTREVASLSYTLLKWCNERYSPYQLMDWLTDQASKDAVMQNAVELGIA